MFEGAKNRDDSAVPSQKPKSCKHRTKFGKNVLGLRKKRNFTQEQVAEKMEISTRYVQSLEAGEYFPSLQTLVRLKSALRCTWEQLFQDCEKV